MNSKSFNIFIDEFFSSFKTEYYFCRQIGFEVVAFS